MISLGALSHNHNILRCYMVRHSHTSSDPHTHIQSCFLLHNLLVSHTVSHSPSQSVPSPHCHAHKLLLSLAQFTPNTAVPTLTLQSRVAHTFTGTRSRSSSHLQGPHTVTHALIRCHNTVTVFHYPTRSVPHRVIQFLTVRQCG